MVSYLLDEVNMKFLISVEFDRKLDLIFDECLITIEKHRRFKSIIIYFLFACLSIWPNLVHFKIVIRNFDGK